MKARIFHATVVFLLTFVFSTLGVYAQDEDILIEPPLTWSINSIQIVWEVTQGSTKTQEAKFIYGADLINSETFGKDQTKNKEKSFGLSGAGGARLDGSIGLDTNPLNRFGLFGAKVNASAYVEGGFNYNQTDRSTDTTQWSDSEKSVVSQALTSAFQQSAQQTISNQQLLFTVDFINHTSKRLYFSPNSANTIPVYCGNVHIGDARLIDENASIAATGKPIPCQFKMSLNDTGKQNLVNNRPTIIFDGGQLLILSNPNDGKPIIKDAIQESTVTTNFFTIAILYGNEVKEWKIQFIEDSPVTVKEALETINKSIRKKQNTSKSVFTIKNNHFISVCKAPFSSENNTEWITELKVYKDEDEQTVDISDPDSCLTDTPQIGDRYIFQLVSQEIKKLGVKAKAGNAVEQSDFALKYYNGDGVPQDKTEAVKWWHKAAEQGFVLAQCNLAYCYKNGEGVSENKAEAVKWWRKAAEQGYPPAQHELGVCLFYNKGIEQDKAEAVKWYRKAAEQGYPPAQHKLGTCLFNGEGIEQDKAEAVKWFHKAAEQGNVLAQKNLGYCYSYGDGIPQNKEEAVKWLRKAADQGNIDAQYILGFMYEYDNGVAINLEEAAKWYRKAAEQGDDKAQFRLGFFYFEGKGIKKDYTEAVKWFRKAADQGNENAQNNLGVCYGGGYGIEKDYLEAVKWFRKAADQGQRDAQFLLGLCYNKGLGVPENKVEAVKWWHKAAENGDKDAQCSLGDCYSNGRGVTPNDQEAVKWYRKAAEQENVPAQRILGAFYYLGKGIPKDKTEAIKWWRKAAEHGDEQAINALKELNIPY